MTKQRRTVTLSKELDDIIAILASGKQMNYSEFLETRLRTLPEVAKTVERINSMPEELALVKTVSRQGMHQKSRAQRKLQKPQQKK